MPRKLPYVAAENPLSAIMQRCSEAPGVHENVELLKFAGAIVRRSREMDDYDMTKFGPEALGLLDVMVEWTIKNYRSQADRLDS